MHFTHRIIVLLLVVLPLAREYAQAQAEFTRTEDVIYGRKFGTALTLDILRPAQTNGYGVIGVISGGFFSSHDAINPQFFKDVLDRGYTVFAVVHGSQPRFIIPDCVADIHRSVRFLRHHAGEYGVRADRLGIFGSSAGGHLSLTLGTQGGPGDAKSKDPIERESSAVQAVCAFFPPTDYLNWGAPGDDAVGVGTLVSFKPAFGPRSDTAESRAQYGHEISPLYFVTGQMAPTFIVHGDADKLVPIYQAEIFAKKAAEAGAVCAVERRPGQTHGWAGIEKDLVKFADWFDHHLRGLPAK